MPNQPEPKQSNSIESAGVDSATTAEPQCTDPDLQRANAIAEQVRSEIEFVRVENLTIRSRLAELNRALDAELEPSENRATGRSERNQGQATYPERLRDSEIEW